MGRRPPPDRSRHPLRRLWALRPWRAPGLGRPVAETRFVVLDTETTGLHPYGGDEVVAIAALELVGLRPTGREWGSLVNPGRPIPPEATALHGLTDADVAGAPPLEALLDAFLEFLGGAVLVGHHTAFDLRFLNRARRRRREPPLANAVIDTMLLYLAASGRLGHYSLEEVAAACGVAVEDRHSARGDARTAARLFVRLAPRLVALDRPLRALLAAQRGLG